MIEKKISVIIRTYNEEKHINSVLRSIFMQKYTNFEIIVVDSESNDSTIDIVSKYNVKLIKIKKVDFNYSYASNCGCENASGDILLFLSGHSVICNHKYFKILNECYLNNDVGGVYGDVIPFKTGGLYERAYYYLGYLKNAFCPRSVEKKVHPGILSCSNASILKSIWEKHQFVEELGNGGEDAEMAHFILVSGYKVLFMRKLLVRHSHHLKYSKFKIQCLNWRNMWSKVEEYIDSHYDNN